MSSGSAGAAAWDWCLARRAAAVAGVATAVALLVVAATDGGGPWSLRLGMTAALAPLCGAIGAFAAVRIAAVRGELRALAAVGAPPGRAVRGAAAGGSAMGLLGPAAVACGMGDLGALFPRPDAARHWVVDGAGLRELTLGVRLGPGGVLALEAPQAAAVGLPTGATGFALLALALAALACPVWLAVPSGATARRAGVGAVVVGVAIVAFQGVAAGRVPAFVLLVAPAVLLGDAVIGGLCRREASFGGT